MATPSKKYPDSWPTLKAAVHHRAGHRCEKCGLPNRAVGYRDAEGGFHPASGSVRLDAAGRGRHPDGQRLTHAEAQAVADDLNGYASADPNAGLRKDAVDAGGRHWFVVQLSTAHLDHDAENPDVSVDRLRAWCQRCHNRYDQPHRQQNAARTRAAKRAKDRRPVVGAAAARPAPPEDRPS